MDEKIKEMISGLNGLVDGDSVIVAIGKKGVFVLIDKEHFGISGLKYKIKNGGRYIYVSKITSWSNKNRKEISLGRYVLGELGYADGMVCDHINGNTLDNRRSNLRYVSLKQNSINRSVMYRTKSGYKNVVLISDKPESGYSVNLQIGINKLTKKRVVIKLDYNFSCNNIDSLAILADCIMLYVNKEYCRTNFDKSMYTDLFVRTYLSLYGVDLCFLDRKVSLIV